MKYPLIRHLMRWYPAGNHHLEELCATIEEHHQHLLKHNRRQAVLFLWQSHLDVLTTSLSCQSEVLMKFESGMHAHRRYYLMLAFALSVSLITSVVDVSPVFVGPMSKFESHVSTREDPPADLQAVAQRIADTLNIKHMDFGVWVEDQGWFRRKTDLSLTLYPTVQPLKIKIPSHVADLQALENLRDQLNTASFKTLDVPLQELLTTSGNRYRSLLVFLDFPIQKVQVDALHKTYEVKAAQWEILEKSNGEWKHWERVNGAVNFTPERVILKKIHMQPMRSSQP
ncbi:hypothetical protein [Deinococcus roseus]|uniref:Uncharacterized protein n=1 Tax=Deinococcus roseus TaxID=392414 RepID=A0ABQ2CZ95_9DEIO|nr:hypothetical protein [Deinococcus roseus]GGJ35569.1 hypothetical protein GCM10008938_22090 [Deinococcus roseus]